MDSSKKIDLANGKTISSKKRSAIKAISWRVTATLTTLLLVYAATGKLKVAGTIASMEVIFKMVLYYVHERVWDKYRF